MGIVIDCGRRPGSGRDRGITAAAAAVRRGELCVLPTEAAYGVAADAFAPHGISRLREVKGRGPDLPLPVLVASVRMAEGIITGLSAQARELISACWPGPLTLIARQQPTLMWGLQAPTLQVRMPMHPLALAVIEVTGPLAVTSANRAGAAAPRTIEAAQAQLADDVAVYLDAGPTETAEPSTVVDVTDEIPVLWRAGAFGADALRRWVPDLIDGTADQA
jgi:L-threonylcarbamoyladenylate synthase